MKSYLDLGKKILEEGYDKSDRTGTGTRSLFGERLVFDLTQGFPLLTTKRVHFKSVIHELLWFLRGESNLSYLHDHNVSIWDEWADDEGELGRIYGVQWRSWQTPDGSTIDQISDLITGLKTNPHSRRHIVSAWNVGEISQMALPPCHILFQFYVAGDSLDCQLYQRSADYFLGVPFNIASYALLTHMVAQVVGLRARRFIHTFGDVHIYTNHFEQVHTQLARQPRSLPTLLLNPEVKDILDYTYSDISVEGYDPHPTIRGKVSV